MSENTRDREALIRISQFVVKKESEALAKDCHRGLVKTILFGCGNRGLSIPEISNEIAEQMGLEGFPYSTIETAIKSPEGKEEIYAKDDKYFLENSAYEQIAKTVAERQKTIDNFESVIREKTNAVSQAQATDGKMAALAVRTTYEFLGSWFGSESSFIANSLKTRKQIIVHSFPDNVLEETLKNIKDKNARRIIHDVITEIFQDLKTDVGRLIFEILQNYLHLELLNIDPECRYLQEVAFSNKTLVLDTNILMNLFLSTAKNHDGINETISIARDLGVKLAFTRRTEQEWLSTLENTNAKYKSVNSQRPSLLPSLNDDFIRSYFKDKTSDSSLTWESYYLQMRQIKSMAAREGIQFWYKKEFTLAKLPNKEYLEQLRGRVYGCANIRGYPKSKSVAEHDAYHLLLVRKLREEIPPDMLGPSCWFLTLDSSLHCTDEGLNQFMSTPFDPPSSFMADLWVSTISPFLGPEISESRLADAFAHLMSTRFATMPTGLSADAVVETLGNWLPYDKLSDKDIELILADALVVKYYNELKEARIKDPSRVEELAAKVRQKVDKKVYEIFDARVSDAEIKEQEAERKKEEAERVASLREKQLASETKQRERVLNVCLALGIIFSAIGLVFLAFNNLATGVAVVISGITFLLISLGFRHFKVKSGPIEMEASQ